MKFTKEAGTAGVTIPKSAMTLSGLSGTEKLELHAQDGAVVLLKREMTAMELLTAVNSLKQLSCELLLMLLIACEECVGCDEHCPYNKENRDIHLPSRLLDAAEIPKDAKLCAEPDPDTGCIIVTAREAGYDLRDVPEVLLNSINECGVCLGSLSELLRNGEVVYGAH